jgi:hypothetical protein
VVGKLRMVGGMAAHHPTKQMGGNSDEKYKLGSNGVIPGEGFVLFFVLSIKASMSTMYLRYSQSTLYNSDDGCFYDH